MAPLQFGGDGEPAIPVQDDGTASGRGAVAFHQGADYRSGNHLRVSGEVTMLIPKCCNDRVFRFLRGRAQ